MLEGNPHIQDWGKIEDWNLTHYTEAFEDQKKVLSERIHNLRPDTLILTEHYPVYTIGARAGATAHLHLTPAQLKQQNIEVSSTNRGGDITYHGPGQIVAYPIISLEWRKDLEAYLRDLEQVLINTLGCLGLAASRRPGKTGIWLKDRKIAALGIAVKQWVTYHGFALNVNVDLTPFQYITPCGISPNEGTVTSMALELGKPLHLQEVKNVLITEFWKVFPLSRQMNH